MSYCLTASCLAHRDKVFWQAQFREWVHTDLRPCEALAGEADPTALACRYCGERVEVDGAGRLLSYVSESYTSRCRVSPTFAHEVAALRRLSNANALDVVP